MPGIFCIISKKNKSQNIEDLECMLDCMAYEPFYSKGTLIEPEFGCYAGWTSIVNSFCDCMPLMNKRNDSIMLFSGENIIDFEMIKSRETRAKAEKMKNASYLIDLYEDNPDRFFKELNGFFHGLIINKREKQITIFNDRYSMRRLYYYEGRDELILSSEAKAILKIRPFLKSISMNSLGEYFSFRCVLENKTLFNDMYLFPGGSKWIVRKNGKIEKGFYFSASEWENKSELDVNEFDIMLNETFKRIVPKYLRSFQKIGLSLTGGLDTRMILAVANLSDMTLPCYTYGGMYKDSFDVKVSRKVARACGQPHEVIRLDSKFIDNFELFAKKTLFISDGLMNISGAPNLYVAALARNIAPVRLTGNYGQEVLRRYIAFKPNVPEKNIFSEDFLPYVKKAKETYFRIFNNQNQLTFAMFMQAPWSQYSRLSIENSQLTQRSPFMDNELVELVYRAPSASLNSEDTSKNIIYMNNKRLSRIMTDLGKLGTMPEPVKSFIKLWRYALFKMEWYYNHKLPGPLETLDNFLKPIDLEKIFLGNNKYFHFRVWLRDYFSKNLKQTLLDNKTKSRKILNTKYIEKIVYNHVNKNMSNTDLICTAYSAELMQRILIDSN